MNDALLIGIDAGGTRTVGALTDSAGHLLSRAEAPSSNYLSVGMEAAVNAIRKLVLALGNTERVLALSIGSSGLDESPEDPLRDEFLARLREDSVLGGIPHHFLRSDAFMALYGLTGGEAGTLLISGTGAMGLALDRHGELHTIAGWGHKLDDPGSGYSVGLAGVQCALAFADGIRPNALMLYQRFMKFYSLSDARAFLPVLYGEGFDKSMIAAFYPEVAACAKIGDPLSTSLLEECADTLFSYAQALCRAVDKHHFPFGIYGSLLLNDTPVRQLFLKKMKSEYPDLLITPPRECAELAAAHYAERMLP